MWQGLIATYKKYLPVTEKTPELTISEGNTPLIRSKYISKLVNANVYFKFEGLNPTGSFKDRGMVMAVAKALEEGSKAIICASTGNTSAAAAAYAAASGLECFVLIPDGKIAPGKLAQALIYGAKVIAIKGNFDQALKLVRDIADSYPITLVNSVNPYRIEGQKTAAFEICDQLNKSPEYLFIPVGNAGNITAYWKGFKEYKNANIINTLPKMMGFEAEGAAAIVLDKVIEEPETIATAIRIGNPASWKGAVNAANESQGEIDYVTDEEIIEAYKLIAQKEGVFAEPASCASVAGLLKWSKANDFNPKDDIVCVLTGNGLKDSVTAMDVVDIAPKTVDAVMEDVLKAMGLT